MIIISKLVTDGYRTWLETMRYLYFTKREAQREYRRRLKAHGWRLA